MKSILYLIIGIPFISGCIFRVKYFDKNLVKKTILLTVTVYTAVGVGYFMDNFNETSRFFYKYSHFIVSSSAPLALIFITIFEGDESLKESDTERKFEKTLGASASAFIFLIIVTNFLYWIGLGNMVTFIGTLISFAIAGMLQALLGPIFAGFNISSSLSSVIFTGTLDNVYVWKNIFSFLQISRTPLRVVLIVVTSIMSVYDSIYNIYGVRFEYFDFDL